MFWLAIRNDLITNFPKVQQDGSIIHFAFKWGFPVSFTDYYPLHLCFNNLCYFYRRQILPFHDSCFSFMSNSILPSPPPMRENRPRPTIRDMREQEYFLQRYRLPQLLPELWLRILPLCLRELSISYHLGRQVQAKTQELCVSDWSVDLSAPIFASYTTLYGRVYLQWLGNTQIPGSHLRSDARGNDSEPPLYIAVGIDHLGVRRLRIVRAGNLSKFEKEATSDGLWWKIASGELRLQIRAGVSDFKARFCFFSDLVIESHNPSHRFCFFNNTACPVVFTGAIAKYATFASSGLHALGG